ncbi:MAG: DUF3299 domain-containing protein [Pseudohongiella sp.]|uniref:DUF3299 domain-containing protein n=1 Tax=Pseudohongiella sp. TaxID=1979412 RepID=UPI0034A08C62
MNQLGEFSTIKPDRVLCLWTALICLLCTPMVLADTYRELDWLDLLTEADRQALMAQPIQQHEPEEGGAQAALGAGRDDIYSDAQASDVWQSVEVVETLDGERVRLPGFIVPLEYNEDRRVTEFFLVPYFGACIHTPAPPPNQIIHVTLDSGYDLPSIYEPYVISGEMEISMTYNEIGISAYSIHADSVTEYRRR